MNCMIGLLCNQNKKRLFSKYLRSSEILKQRGINVVIFSIQNVSLGHKTVYGTLVADGKAVSAKTELPSVIINFAVQYAKAHIKKLKRLSETENLTLINPVNSFNQWTILKMLSSCAQTNPYILPYSYVSYENAISDIQKIDDFIIKPRNGSNYNKFIYCKKTSSGFDLYNFSNIARSHLFDIKNAIIPAIRSGKWILINSPKLKTRGGSLLIIRTYLHKNRGEWEVVQKTAISKTEKVCSAYDEINQAALRLALCVTCYIPDLAFCTVDFVVDKDGKPYFLSLGGWQDIVPQKAPHKMLLEHICRSITAYAEKYELMKVI